MMALLYMVTAAGFALNLHYCGNYVADVKINAPADACARPMAKSKMDCCKDSHLTVKVKDDHQKESTSFNARLFAFDLPRFPVVDFLSVAQLVQSENLVDRGPPDVPLNGTPVFIKNCIFRI